MKHRRLMRSGGLRASTATTAPSTSTWWLLPWPVALLVILLLHGVSAWQLTGLRLNNAPDLYYPAGSAAVVLRDELRRDFPSDEMLTVVLQGPDVYNIEVLKRLDRVAQRLQTHPLVDRVSTVTTMERISGSEEGFSVAPLLDLKAGAADAVKLRQRVLEDRFAPGLLASRDGSTLALAVRPRALQGSADRLLLQIAVVGAIQQEGLGSFYAGDAGPITVDVAQLLSMMSDTRVFVPLTGALGLALLYWVVGRVRPVLIGGVALSTVILPVVGGIAASGQPYTMASAILPSLLAAYTMATLMHLYAGIQRAQSAGLGRHAAVHAALRETARPGLYNVLTTGAGLLSLTLVPMPPIQVFGMAGAAGTVLVFVTVYGLIPPLLLRWDRRRWPSRQSNMGRMGRVAARLAVASMRRPRTMVLSTLALMALGLPLIAQVQVETDVLSFFHKDHAVNRHTAIVETKLAGVTSLEVSVRADGRDGLLNVERLAALRAFQDWLERLPEVDRSVSMVDLVEEMHWAMNDERPAFRTLPPDDRLLSQYMLIYDGQDLYELVNRDFQHARVLLNLNIHGASEIGRTIRHIEARLAAQPLPGLQVEIGGYGRLFADQVDLLVTGQVHSFAAAFTQILLLMALLWRSFASAAICMVPNVAPLFFIFVLMGATAIHLDMATVMIAGVVLGITVDDTIHLYHGYRERLEKGATFAAAMVGSYRASGRAVLATTVLVTAQFGLLAASDFIPTANFGKMAAVGLLAGQAAEFLLLPALLVLHQRWRAGSSLRDFLRPTPSRAAGAGMTDPVDDWQPTILVDRPVAPVQKGSSDATPLHGRDLSGPTQIQVCVGPVCAAAGAEEAFQWLAAMDIGLGSRVQGEAGPRAVAVRATCLGRCQQAPIVQVVSGDIHCSGATVLDRLGAAVRGAGLESPADVRSQAQPTATVTAATAANLARPGRD